MKGRKRRGNIGVVIVFVIMLLLMSGMAFYFLTGSERAMKNNKWGRNIDLTSQVVSKASEWIGVARMGDEVDVSAYVPEIKASVVLSFDSAGNWTETLDEESLNRCNELANAAIKDAFMAVLSKRLEAAGCSEGDIDSLILSALGMSLDDYFKEYGPNLLPTYEELSAEVSKEGHYKLKGGKLYRSFDAYVVAVDGVEEDFVCNSAALAIASEGDEAILYTKWEGQ